MRAELSFHDPARCARVVSMLDIWPVGYVTKHATMSFTEVFCGAFAGWNQRLRWLADRGNARVNCQPIACRL